MTQIVAFGLILAFLWGAFWALLLQATGWGRYMAAKRAWLTVVIGVGVDLLILGALIPDQWWIVVAVIACSSVGLVIRSLVNEERELRALTDMLDKRVEDGSHDHQDPPGK